MNENRMSLAEFAKEVHENAKEHGWWDEERSDAGVRALIHSEWSEALEEARAGRPLVWHGCKSIYTDICELCTTCINKADGKRVGDCGLYMNKPEGIAIELIDGCIRIMDWCGKLGMMKTNEEPDEQGMLERLSCEACGILTNETMGVVDPLGMTMEMVDVATLVDVLHACIAKHRTAEHHLDLLCAYGLACAWVRAQGLDPVKLMQEKHEYNKTRPYKHGKRF